jgi:predicted Rossmann fold flavoprotein
MLLAECTLGKVELVFNARDIAVDRGASSGFRIATSQGEFHCDALIVATGGLSIPKLGATGFAYELARQFDLEIVPPRPALVPLILSGEEVNWTQLAGVATEVEAWAGSPRARPRFREKMLLTHRGLSGPAILQASSYWRPGEPVFVDFAPGLDGDADLLAPLLEPGAPRNLPALRQALRAVLPQRLAAFLAETAPPDGWRNAALAACAHTLRNFAFHPAGTEGFEKAEVTAGGVHTAGLQPRTLEARAASGLFFVGEAVDVTGHLGGFNFQWAWASAMAAARAL